jgi:hypothetical protein
VRNCGSEKNDKRCTAYLSPQFFRVMVAYFGVEVVLFQNLSVLRLQSSYSSHNCNASVNWQVLVVGGCHVCFLRSVLLFAGRPALQRDIVTASFRSTILLDLREHPVN